MTISEVYNLIPNEQIKKIVGVADFETPFEDYEIYDSTGKKILILMPLQEGNSNSKISRISILDDRFRTTEEIGLNSTFGDLKKYYSINKIEPYEEEIGVYVEHINACFLIKKTELNDGWWNNGSFDIPNTAKVYGISVWWK